MGNANTNDATVIVLIKNEIIKSSIVIGKLLIASNVNILKTSIMIGKLLLVTSVSVSIPL